MPSRPCQRSGFTRRQALAGFGSMAFMPLAACARNWDTAPVALNANAPTAPVSIARCAGYGAELLPTLGTMFDQLGGLGQLVAGKTVALKLNMTGGARERLGTTPSELAHYTHPAVAGATIRLLAAAGARRIRVLEGAFATNDPLEEFMLDAGWDPLDLLNAAPNVELENTNVLGRGSRYHRMMAATPGYIFSGFDFNHAWAESDVVVSIAKMKEHATCGITLGMKNMFGATPITIYGDAAGKDEPSLEARSGRGVIMHNGQRAPSKSAPQEVNPLSPREQGYRMPRIVVDVCAALPVHLTIIDGIQTMAGGEGPWTPQTGRIVKPGLLFAGLNPVCTDAVCTAVMGYDTQAKHGSEPFEKCDNYLALANARGLGTHDLNRIEVAGVSIKDALFPFRKHRPGGFPASI